MITFIPPAQATALPLAPGQLVVVRYQNQQWLALSAVNAGHATLILLLGEGTGALTPKLVPHQNVRDPRLPSGTFSARVGESQEALFESKTLQPYDAPLVVDSNGEAWISASDEYATAWFNLSTGHGSPYTQLADPVGYTDWSLWRTTSLGEELLGTG